MRGNDAEAYNNQGNRKRCCGIEYKVVAVGLKIDAYCCHLWQKEIVKQINIERPTTNELKTPTYHCLIREKLLKKPILKIILVVLLRSWGLWIICIQKAGAVITRR